MGYYSPEYRGKYGSDYPIKRRRAKLRKAALAEAPEYLHEYADYTISDVEPEESIPTAWELAIARAELIAKLYAMHLREQKKSHPDLPNASQRRLSKPPRYAPQRFCKQKLLKIHNVHLSGCLPRPSRLFLEEHGMRFCQSLQTSLRGPIHLKPAPLAPTVQERFFAACSGDLDGRLLPAFHGTAAGNLSSIYKNGLLIPGVENTLKVANGSAHGLGIYTATIDNPQLSLGFCCGEQSMLVCGVLSNAVSNSSIEHIGNLQVTSESCDVLHVGNAMVIFDIRRVAPLFVATRYIRACNAKSCHTPQRKHRPRKHRPRKKAYQIPPTSIVAFLRRRGAKKRRDST